MYILISLNGAWIYWIMQSKSTLCLLINSHHKKTRGGLITDEQHFAQWDDRVGTLLITCSRLVVISVMSIKISNGWMTRMDEFKVLNIWGDSSSSSRRRPRLVTQPDRGANSINYIIHLEVKYLSAKMGDWLWIRAPRKTDQTEGTRF